MALSALSRRRWRNFRSNKRAFWSLWIFATIYTLSLFAELIANDKPLLVRYDGAYYAQIATSPALPALAAPPSVPTLAWPATLSVGCTLAAPGVIGQAGE